MLGPKQLPKKAVSWPKEHRDGGPSACKSSEVARTRGAPTSYNGLVALLVGVVTYNPIYNWWGPILQQCVLNL